MIVITTVFILSIVDISRNKNVSTSTTVVPVQTLGVSNITGYFAIDITLNDFADSTCENTLVLYTQLRGAITIKSTMIRPSACNVILQCQDCTFTGSLQQIMFEFGQSYASASSIDYKLTFPYYDGKSATFTIAERVMPNDPLRVFRGAEPTEISLSSTITQFLSINPADYFFYSLGSQIFRSNISNSQTGYSILPTGVTMGTTSDAASFWSHSFNGVRVAFSINANPNAVLVQQTGKFTLLDFFSKIFALISASYAALAFIMNRSEKYIVRWRETKQKQETQMATEMKVIATVPTVVAAPVQEKATPVQ